MVTADWEDAPPISPGLPVTLRIGSVGAGIGLGCGVGIGFGGPLNLGVIPGLQQASQGLSAGLTGLSPLLGGAATTVRAAVRGLGVPGLDVGFGCGVGVGYGFGAGLMLKPSVMDQLVKSGTQVLGQAANAINSKLHANSGSQQHGTSIPGTTQVLSSSGNLPAVGPYFSSENSFDAATTTTNAQGMLLDISSMIGKSSSSSNTIAPSGSLTIPAEPAIQQQGPLTDMTSSSNIASQALQQTQSHQDVVIMRTLLTQQQELALLKKQNEQLMQAVCRLDPGAPFCSDGKS